MSAFALRGLDVQDDLRTSAWPGGALAGITVLLLGFGLLAVYSASSFIAQSEGLPDSYYLAEQASRAAIGLVLLVGLRFVDYRLWRRLAWPLVGAAAGLLAICLLPGTEAIAPEVNGSRRWIRVGALGVIFQPSEIAKIAVIVWTASLAVKKQDRLDSFKGGLAPFLVVVGLLCLLVLAEPHLSAAAILVVLAGVILFAAGVRIRHFAVAGALAVPVLWLHALRTSYPLERVGALLNPSPAGGALEYQLHQSLIAVGSGGAFGLGFGESRQKLHYLPEPQNDFIFSIIAEEWGFLGTVTVVALFLAWTLLGLRIASDAPDLLGRLLAVGITALVGVAAFAHIGVNLGLLPPTGVNLPFVSAGGTHLVLTLGATGILLNIASRRRC